mgnify:CR=1 FL=1
MAETPATVVSQEAHRRSLTKAITWRITGSVDTFLISWLVTGNPVVAVTISAIEIVTKIFLYYLHERVWGKIRWGKQA